jgi:CHRD domain
MPSTRALFLLNLAVLMGCATEKSAAEKAPAVNPPAIKNFALTTGDEVPPCSAAAPGAQGTANVTLSPDESSLIATVNYSGLSGPATAAHIHAGKAGVAGPVVLPFSGDLTSPINKTLTAADYVAAPNAPPDFPSFVQSLKTGGAYVNVHTAACKPGEIRGQIP